MIVLGIKMQNILCFNEFSADFTYPKKLTNSLISEESLSQYPNFRYKKVNILIGSNATGKTCFIKTLWKYILFLSKKEDSIFLDLINKNKKESFIQMDIVSGKGNKKYIYRITTKCDNLSNNPNVLVSTKKLPINLTSSYQNRLPELDILPNNFKNYLEALKELDLDLGWNVILPATENQFNKVSFQELNSEVEEKDYLNILNAVFKTLDPSISNIYKSKDSNDAYVIEHQISDRKIIVQKGMQLSAIPYLSSGTKYGFNISNMIYSIKNGLNGLYLVDEQFSYVDSDIECAILSLMVSMLGENQQIFFTTHNTNILDLGFPFHTFNFMKKEIINNEAKITMHCASEIENRNNVSPKSILENDSFNLTPKIDLIYSLNEE